MHINASINRNGQMTKDIFNNCLKFYYQLHMVEDTMFVVGGNPRIWNHL